MKRIRPAVIHQDDHIVVASKPSGLLSIPDRFNADRPHLQGWLTDQFGPMRIVHRLDFETSGILVFARTEDAQRHLSRQFGDRTVKKIYWALVEGRVTADEGRIEKPIGPHPSKSGRMQIDARGKDALTTFQVIERYQQFTELELEIHTGRTHQVRVHAASIGHPLAVDAFYGPREALFLSQIKGKNSGWENIRKNARCCPGSASTPFDWNSCTRKPIRI
jgi:23S rRNA pseudouridine1911/1915/1917 synthase